ncbi:hypothetical protein JJJ17_02575 [Paracoccus caeni]|uniref:Uncharacterized protein n=1 Tax=Paracoccus caeni TaxID=657651 RepID=A0A934S9F2_9RHOB|nr:hypothetical protein [Paracoccus caeni]MBK4214805.1 hypothetical protein [Paracoccus caeni]
MSAKTPETNPKTATEPKEKPVLDPVEALEAVPLTPAEQDQALAAELVLGVLETADTEAARARQTADPAFALLVRQWQERMSGMAADMTPIMPPARARQRIRETLGLIAAPLSVDPTETTPWYRGPLGLVLLAAIAVGAYFLFR